MTESNGKIWPEKIRRATKLKRRCIRVLGKFQPTKGHRKIQRHQSDLCRRFWHFPTFGEPVSNGINPMLATQTSPEHLRPCGWMLQKIFGRRISMRSLQSDKSTRRRCLTGDKTLTRKNALNARIERTLRCVLQRRGSSRNSGTLGRAINTLPTPTATTSAQSHNRLRRREMYQSLMVRYQLIHTIHRTELLIFTGSLFLVPLLTKGSHFHNGGISSIWMQTITFTNSP